MTEANEQTTPQREVTTPKVAINRFVRNTDGTATATVLITLSKDDWLKYERLFKIRAMSCNIGLDNPRVEDNVMFQIFSQITGR